MAFLLFLTIATRRPLADNLKRGDHGNEATTLRLAVARSGRAGAAPTRGPETRGGPATTRRNCTARRQGASVSSRRTPGRRREGSRLRARRVRTGILTRGSLTLFHIARCRGRIRAVSSDRPRQLPRLRDRIARRSSHARGHWLYAKVLRRTNDERSDQSLLPRRTRRETPARVSVVREKGRPTAAPRYPHRSRPARAPKAAPRPNPVNPREPREPR